MPDETRRIYKISAMFSKTRPLFLFLLAATLAAEVSAQGVINITTDKDNTLYESTTGTVSNGAGVAFFCGRTNMGKRRRGLIHFDVAGNVPAGATIVSVALTLEMNQTAGGPINIDLRKVLADWGEGTSAPAMGNGGSGAPATTGDATWLHRFYPTVLWAATGGDFDAVASATLSVWQGGYYTWSTAQMAIDVQNWLNSPATNFGWMLKSPETIIGDSKRFGSKEEYFPISWPKLVITYLAPPTSAATDLGLGCNGIQLTPIGVPSVGNSTFTLDLTGAQPGLLVIGVVSDGFVPYVLDLGGGCFFSLEPVSAINYLNAGILLGPLITDNLGHAPFLLPIPPSALFHGITADVQCLVFGTTATVSNVIALVIGS